VIGSRSVKRARELEKEKPGKGEARNYLFELVIAGLLKRAGFKVCLDRIEDVSFEYSDRPFFIECKRIHSQAKLQERIDHAAVQIGKRCDDAETLKARGIVAVDVSKLLNNGKAFLYCSTLRELNSEVESLFKLFRLMNSADLGIECTMDRLSNQAFSAGTVLSIVRRFPNSRT
jgi:hypothetical protein